MLREVDGVLFKVNYGSKGFVVSQEEELRELMSKVW